MAQPKTESWLQRRWYSGKPAPFWLLPFAALYGFIAALRRGRLQALAQKLPVPVIVVGNISVGGTGKTPYTLWLVQRLREWGWKPGIISRGYGGRAPSYPLRVQRDTDPKFCGDEPALMARRLGCPVVVAPDRVAAARMLIESGEVDILVSDDGLQHYKLARDVEICVVDAARGFGNHALLPAGPLREPPQRIESVDFLICNGPSQQVSQTPQFNMRLVMQDCIALEGGARKPLKSFAGKPVHAVAGIGHPQRFFLQLLSSGLQVYPHPYPDHYHYGPVELRFGDGLPVLMTEKDAVKCQPYATPGQWMVPVEAQFSADHAEAMRKLLELKIGRKS